MTGIVAFLAWAAAIVVAVGLVSLLTGLVIGGVIKNRDRHG